MVVWAMTASVACVGWAMAPFSVLGCGLDWTLPQAHFDGVEEHGYVAYWEKIGEIDLGEKLVLPVHIGFDSHRETSSPALGKGWIVPLLESHVEPIDENSMSVVMPDGWTFRFLRNGNSETWRGNAGWAGETDNGVFNIAAPCGWKIRFADGKIQEIDGPTGIVITYRYDEGAATEIDAEGKALMRLERDPVTGQAADLLIGDTRIDITLAQRPRVTAMLRENLISGFDSSVSSLQWPDTRKENFSFAMDKDLNPMLTVSGTDLAPRIFTWNPKTRQIKSDGDWSYSFDKMAGHLRFTRVSAQPRTEIYESDDSTGMTEETTADGAEVRTYRFASGPLVGLIRRIEQVGSHGARTLLYSASYFPSGQIMREMFYPDKVRFYSEQRQLLKETIGGRVDYEQDFDSEGRSIHIVNTAKNLEVKTTYDSHGGQTTEVFQHGALFYTENVDGTNKLVSLNEGEK
jgi:hypothetical protein